jgi:hypothetical protein
MTSTGMGGNLQIVCANCQAPPVPGSKLRYCGRCLCTQYCGKLCAAADWAEHKLACESLRRGHDGDMAEHEEAGGTRKEFRQGYREDANFFAGVPGMLTLLYKPHTPTPKPPRHRPPELWAPSLIAVARRGLAAVAGVQGGERGGEGNSGHASGLVMVVCGASEKQPVQQPREPKTFV